MKVLVKLCKLSKEFEEVSDDNIYVINTNYSDKTELDYQSIFNEQINNFQRSCDIPKRNFGDLVEYIEKINNIGLYINDLNEIEVGAENYELIDVSKDTLKNEVWLLAIGYGKIRN